MVISWQRLSIVIVSIGLIYISIVYVIPLVLPFILGWMIAAIIQPMVNKIQQITHLPRLVSILLALFFVFILFFVITAMAIYIITKELVQFIYLLPGYITQFFQFLQERLPFEVIQKYYEQFYVWYATQFQHTPIEQSIKPDQWLQMVVNQLIRLIQQLLTGITQFVIAIPNAATIIVFTLLAAIFISKDLTRINDWVWSKIPTRIKQTVGNVYKNLRTALWGFMKTQFILISSTMILSSIGLWILNIKHAFAIGILIGFIDIIPFLGTGTIFIPWILYLFFTQQYSLVVGLSILYGLIIISRQLMEPKLLSANFGIHPLHALIALFVGLQILGFWGLWLGPFFVIILQTLHRSNFFTDLWKYILVQK